MGCQAQLAWKRLGILAHVSRLTIVSDKIDQTGLVLMYNQS